MKSLSLCITLLLFASFATAQAVSTHGSGAQAEVFTNAVNVIVTSGLDHNGSPGTLLSFHTGALNPDGTITFVIGFGFIPNEAFIQHGPDKMELNVDTSQVAGYNNTTCIFTPFPNFGFNCHASQGGPLQLSWHGNGLNSQDDIRHTDTTFGPITQHEESDGGGGSADASGNVMGIPVAVTGQAFGAFVSSGHFTNITITQR
jgi:hypothetical protein